MTTRASFIGTLVLGEVLVRVKACPMTGGDIDTEFHLLHRTCLLPLSQEYRCPKCNLLIPTGERVKGTETGGRWVVFTEEEIGSLKPEQTETRPILVSQTIKPALLSPRWRMRSYFLAPELPGDYRGYCVLEQTLARTGLGLVVSFSDHGRTRLGVVGSDPDLPGWLILDLLHYQADLRTADPQKWRDVHPDKQELKLARTLILKQLRPFVHAAHVDPFPARLKAAIELKLQQRPLRLVERPPVPVAGPGPLVDTLRRSLKAATARINRTKKRPVR